MLDSSSWLSRDFKPSMIASMVGVLEAEAMVRMSVLSELVMLVVVKKAILLARAGKGDSSLRARYLKDDQY